MWVEIRVLSKSSVFWLVSLLLEPGRAVPVAVVDVGDALEPHLEINDDDHADALNDRGSEVLFLHPGKGIKVNLYIMKLVALALNTAYIQEIELGSINILLNLRQHKFESS